MERTFSLTDMTQWITRVSRENHPEEFATLSSEHHCMGARDASPEMAGIGHVGRPRSLAAQEFAALDVGVDWQAVAQVVCQQAPGLVAQERMQTLEDRLQRLPRQILETNPWLLYWSGICCLPHEPGQGRADLVRAYVMFCSRDVQNRDVRGMLYAWAGVVDSILLNRTDFTLLDDWVKALRDFLDQHPAFPSLDVEARVTQAMLGALTQHQPSHFEASLWEQRARQLLQSGLEVDQQFKLGNRLVLYYLQKGDSAAAAWVLHTLKAHASRPCAAIQVEWYSSQALYSLLVISAEECLKMVADGLEIARNTGVRNGDFQLYALGAQAALVKGDDAVAEEFLGHMGVLLIANRHLDASLYHYLLAWDSLGHNDLARATEYARLALTLAEEVGAPYQQSLCHALLAQVLFEYGGYREAMRHLVYTRAGRDIVHSKYIDCLVLMLEAQFRFMRSSDVRGINALSAAFALARKYGYINVPVMRPCVMAILCKKALENGIEVEYVRSYIKVHGLQPPGPSVECAAWPWPIKIYTLGRFSIVRGNEALDFAGKDQSKAQGKPLQLLKALIALGGRDISEVQLIDALWPDAEGDAGHQVFRITLHRLRQLLGHEKVIVLRDGNLTLDTSCCWVDVWALERFFGQQQSTRGLAMEERALDLYQGHFLGNDIEYPWALALRERLRSKFHRHLERMARQYEDANQWEKAVNSYRKGLEIDPLAEVFYQRLMLCYQRQGRCVEALSVYQRCHTVFAAMLGIAPSAHLEATRRTLAGN